MPIMVDAKETEGKEGASLDRLVQHFCVSSLG